MLVSAPTNAQQPVSSLPFQQHMHQQEWSSALSDLPQRVLHCQEDWAQVCLQNNSALATPFRSIKHDDATISSPSYTKCSCFSVKLSMANISFLSLE